MDFVPEESALAVETIEVDRDTMDMLKSLNMGRATGRPATCHVPTGLPVTCHVPTGRPANCHVPAACLLHSLSPHH